MFDKNLMRIINKTGRKVKVTENETVDEEQESVGVVFVKDENENAEPSQATDVLAN